MKILVTGGTGLIGSRLVPALEAEGHEVVLLRRVRQDHEKAGPTWDLNGGRVDLSPAGAIDAVIHLAGENIAGRWTRRKKERIRASRVEGTQMLVEALLAHGRPSVFISASAIHYYGDCGDDWVDEEGAAGEGFLPKIVQDWERAALPLKEAGTRIAWVRLGMVLSDRHGALRAMLPAFRMGLGGRVGSGRQYWSWIGLSDAVTVFRQAVERSDFNGPINGVAPGTVTNSEFTRTLGRVLRRPTVLPLPGWVAKAVLGKMADELLLTSMRARPKRLEEAGFEFGDPDLETALKRIFEPGDHRA